MTRGAPLARLLVLALVASLVLVPLVAVALGGLKTMGELRTAPFGLPDAWAWGTYGRILGGAPPGAVDMKGQAHQITAPSGRARTRCRGAG